MRAFLYAVTLQWKLDIRSKTLLITCYIVPLFFFAIMGGIFTTIMPEAKYTLIQSMTVFGIAMGALVGLPPSLVETYGSDIKNVYKANGVPLCLGLILTNISTYIHLFIMSIILYMIAPVAFDAEIPANPAAYFGSLAVYIIVSLSIASIIGLAVKDPSKTSMISIMVFLPSIMLSGIMFPINLLPKSLKMIGNLFPAAWGYKLTVEPTFDFGNLWPLLSIFLITVFVCGILLKKLAK